MRRNERIAVRLSDSVETAYMSGLLRSLGAFGEGAIRVASRVGGVVAVLSGIRGAVAGLSAFAQISCQ